MEADMILLSALVVLAPQASAPMFPFVIPWDDDAKGTVTDVSFLNTMPAGKNGRIVVRNGHYAEEKTGRRVRFLGTNFTGRMAFPSREDADKVAARLAKLGANIVRFHHLQNDWDLNGGTIWKEDRIHREIDPERLDRLFYLIGALKKQGIYSNINLQTTRKYFPDMGFPESVLQIPTEFAKKIDKVDRKMIELQKDYAKQVLDVVNPYTGLKLSEDPAVAVVEINNENSLVGWPGEVPGAGLAAMPEPFRGKIVAQWNTWLKHRYTDRKGLEESWLQGVTPAGPSLVTQESKWTHENQSNGDVQPAGVNIEGRTQDQAPPIGFEIRSNPGPDWHVQSHLAGLDLKNGDTYTLRFWAKSSQENRARVAATLDQPDWRFIGLNRTFDIGPEERSYTYVFTVNGAEPNHGRIAFSLGDVRGNVEIKHLSLAPGMPNQDVADGYERGEVALPEGGTARQMADYAEFLADTETAYSTEMREYLRRVLNVKANLVDTQQSWGGLTSLKRERGSDFADNHSYFQHPAFAKSWDPVEWTIPNTPMVAQLATGYAELGGLAQYRVAGRPYAVSEYNHPAPNDFRAEMMPLIMSFAALQNWDAIYTFDYGATGTGLENEKIQGFFGVATDPSKMAFFPSAALMFRGFAVAPLKNEVVLEVPMEKPWVPEFTAWSAWGKAGLPDLWQTRIAIQASNPRGPVLKKTASSSTPSKTVRIEGREKPFLVVDSPSTKAAVGFVGNGSVKMQGLDLRFPAFGNNFATVTLAAHDRRRLDQSSRILLTLVGKVENQDMVWKDEKRTSVGDKWGNGPTVAEGIPCQVRLMASGPRSVYALDGSGKRRRAVPSRFVNGHVAFETDAKYGTLWYEVVTEAGVK
ncbi:MAG TPA: hypothetical protein VGE01_05070 [Fimbriimonas sp.]